MEGMDNQVYHRYGSFIPEMETDDREIVIYVFTERADGM